MELCARSCFPLLSFDLLRNHGITLIKTLNPSIE